MNRVGSARKGSSVTIGHVSTLALPEDALEKETRSFVFLQAIMNRDDLLGGGDIRRVEQLVKYLRDILKAASGEQSLAAPLAEQLLE